MIRDKAQEIKDARKLLFDLVKVADLKQEVFASIPDIHSLDTKREFQISNLRKWCKLLNMPYKRASWSGNAVCNSDWDIIWFVFADVKFFELVEKRG